ncbi:hypothetical protein M752DRAFT_261365 [Aspergillus phoenicis ATCC 13157]|uniref:Uncharacterized protein n=2 Tax=Aspergillus TaxID=5052 RepID=A0A370Q0U0_ASPPH|nr:hypothetical protein M747DRAFT_307318 [Aspergillus niger ATCC 13496]RDK48059.1 hypothetical protein M752DRAFT_261365 [Aspergillus phoenicis ATCC 13157]
MRSSILLVAFSALAAAQSSVAVPQGQPSAAVTSSPVIPTQGSLPAGASSVLIGSSGVPSSFAKSASASASTSTKTSTKTSSSDSSTSTSDSSSKSGSSSSSSTSSGAGVPLATAGPVGLSVVAGAALAAFLDFWNAETAPFISNPTTCIDNKSCATLKGTILNVIPKPTVIEASKRPRFHIHSLVTSWA